MQTGTKNTAQNRKNST